MRARVMILLAASLVAASAVALEVRLRDGTVIEATDVTVTGSYVLLELADGRKVAYDLADVDVEALAAARRQPTPAPAADSSASVLAQGGGRTLAMPPEEGGGSRGLAITDRDVEHVRRGGSTVGDEGTGESPDGGQGVPEGYQTDGRVGLASLTVTAQGEDRWLVEGEVVNRRASPVMSVRVQLRTVPFGDEPPWAGEVAVADTLEPNQKGTFSTTFQAAKPAERDRPTMKATVLWMQRGEPAAEPPSPGARRAPNAAAATPQPDL